MEHRSLDPYEQQLLKVFNSYDIENCGSLNKDGLTQLCKTLQLEEYGNDLIECLLKGTKNSRATFLEFRDALLALLGNIQNSKSSDGDIITNKNDSSSPDREVSPKYVYGSKKYGRRSRPRQDEVSSSKDENDCNYSNKTTNNGSITVQRSNSQSSVYHSKKRKTNYQLKRCTSLPGREDFSIRSSLNNGSNDAGEFICTEDMLREAWNKLGVGKDGYLNQTEILLVCDAIGLDKLAKGVIRKLKDKFSIDFDQQISFQELLEILQQDDTWIEVLSGSTCDVQNDDRGNMTRVDDGSVLMDSHISAITLGPQADGTIDTNTVIEMWENVGITSPKLLLSDLGFNTSRINVSELATALDKEIKALTDSDRCNIANPHVTLLLASLTLFHSEIRTLQTILEQMNVEREKLKCDVYEANNRATLLAQEVDDNHARMEKSAQNQVKLLEQKHSDVLRELTEQFSNEKEKASLLRHSLEEKISSLEEGEAKLRNDLMLIQKYSASLEKENGVLSEQLQDLQVTKSAMNERIEYLEGEKQKYMEIEKVEPLLAKLEALQLENSLLRDKNDEMVAEVESMSSQLNSMRAKMSSVLTGALDKSMEENISIICEGVVGLGSKRRNDESPSKDISLIGDGSPRLGKVRKYQKTKDALEVPFASNESGFDTEIECFDFSCTSPQTENDEVTNLQTRIKCLEQVLLSHGIPFPSDMSSIPTDTNVMNLQKRCTELEKCLSKIKSKVTLALTEGIPETDALHSVNEELGKLILDNSETLEAPKVDNSTETEERQETLEELINQYEEENKALSEKCEELEKCVDLLKNEYEKCEDYWAAKLDEERQMFEKEQMQTSEKLNELIIQVNEYEEQFASQRDSDNKLPIIEENHLERQFVDLEREFEDYKERAESLLLEKDNEICYLKGKLEEVIGSKAETSEIGIQAELGHKLSHLSNHVVESTNLFSMDTLPAGNDTKFEFSNPTSSTPTNVDTSSIWNNTENSLQWQTAQSEFSSPSTSTSTPCRPKRTRKCDRNSVLSQRVYKRNQEESSSHRVEQTCVLPVSSIYNLNNRLHHLEQRCRHLQIVLKQHHYYAEQMLHNYWQQYKGENAELQYLLKNSQEKLEQQTKTCNEQIDKLVKADMLVKDLYIENSYLVANVQRLEQRCHMLSQCSSHSCSM